MLTDANLGVHSAIILHEFDECWVLEPASTKAVKKQSTDGSSHEEQNATDVADNNLPETHNTAQAPTANPANTNTAKKIVCKAEDCVVLSRTRPCVATPGCAANLIAQMPKRSVRCFGIVGIMEGLSGMNCLVIDSRTTVGNLAKEAPVYRIDSVMCVPLGTASSEQLSDEQRKDEKTLFESVCNTLTCGFYMCYSQDISTSQQQRQKTNLANVPLWQQCDPRFFWNAHLVESFMRAELHSWILPLIFGYVEIATVTFRPGRQREQWVKQTAQDGRVVYFDTVTKTLSFDPPWQLEQETWSDWEMVNGEGTSSQTLLTSLTNTVHNNTTSTLSPSSATSALTAPVSLPPVFADDAAQGADIPTKTAESSQSCAFEMIFISRRSRARAGTRYHVRGIDSLGNVANYVETEQIVRCNGKTASFVQVRGSVPVFWKQITGFQYRPKPSLDQGLLNTTRAFKAHFDEQIRIYGDQLCVNLVNQKGREALLESAYHEQILLHGIQNIKYTAFDFHTECKGMNYGNLSKLLDETRETVMAQKFYLEHTTETGTTVLKQQNGVIRTNCVDCLDRTNVVQTMYSQVVLSSQMRELGLMFGNESISQDSAFEKFFKHLWANNADALSKQYTTTGALKADFTRTGKRRLQGLVGDGINSVMRYYQNTFRDDDRQDSIDLLAGVAAMNPFARSPITDGEPQYMDVFVCTAFKVLSTGDKRPVTVEVEMLLGNLEANSLVWTTREGVSQRCPLQAITTVERHSFNTRLVRLFFIASYRPVPLDLLFPTFPDREIFVQKIFTARNISISPPPPPAISESGETPETTTAAAAPAPRRGVLVRTSSVDNVALSLTVVVACVLNDDANFWASLRRAVCTEDVQFADKGLWQPVADDERRHVSGASAAISYHTQVELQDLPAGFTQISPIGNSRNSPAVSNLLIDLSEPDNTTTATNPNNSGSNTKRTEEVNLLDLTSDMSSTVPGPTPLSGLLNDLNMNSTTPPAQSLQANDEDNNNNDDDDAPTTPPSGPQLPAPSSPGDHPLADELRRYTAQQQQQQQQQQLPRSHSKSDPPSALPLPLFAQNEMPSVGADMVAVGAVRNANVLDVRAKFFATMGERGAPLFETLCIHLFSDLCLIVFVRNHVVPHITNIHIGSASLGASMGKAIAVSMHVQESRICMLLVSLPKGDNMQSGKGKGGNEGGWARFSDALCEALSLGPLDLMANHHHVFVFGMENIHPLAAIEEPGMPAQRIVGTAVEGAFGKATKYLNSLAAGLKTNTAGAKKRTKRGVSQRFVNPQVAEASSLSVANASSGRESNASAKSDTLIDDEHSGETPDNGDGVSTGSSSSDDDVGFVLAPTRYSYDDDDDDEESDHATTTTSDAPKSTVATAAPQTVTKQDSAKQLDSSTPTRSQQPAAQENFEPRMFVTPHSYPECPLNANIFNGISSSSACIAHATTLCSPSFFPTGPPARDSFGGVDSEYVNVVIAEVSVSNLWSLSGAAPTNTTSTSTAAASSATTTGSEVRCEFSSPCFKTSMVSSFAKSVNGTVKWTDVMNSQTTGCSLDHFRTQYVTVIIWQAGRREARPIANGVLRLSHTRDNFVCQLSFRGRRAGLLQFRMTACPSMGASTNTRKSSIGGMALNVFTPANPPMFAVPNSNSLPNLVNQKRAVKQGVQAANQNIQAMVSSSIKKLRPVGAVSAKNDLARRSSLDLMARRESCAVDSAGEVSVLDSRDASSSVDSNSSVMPQHVPITSPTADKPSKFSAAAGVKQTLNKVKKQAQFFTAK